MPDRANGARYQAAVTGERFHHLIAGLELRGLYDFEQDSAGIVVGKLQSHLTFSLSVLDSANPSDFPASICRPQFERSGYQLGRTLTGAARTDAVPVCSVPFDRTAAAGDPPREQRLR